MLGIQYTLWHYQTSKVRLPWLDQLKVALIILVVVGHSAMPFFGVGAFIAGFAASTDSLFLRLALCMVSLLKPLVVPVRGPRSSRRATAMHVLSAWHAPVLPPHGRAPAKHATCHGSSSSSSPAPCRRPLLLIRSPS